MEERSFAARDLIQLPRMSAPQTVVLLTEVITAWVAATKALNPKQIPKAIDRAFSRMEAAHAELVTVLTPQSKAGDTQAKRKADRVVDGAWAALFSWLNGWCQLPAEVNPHQDQAIALRDLVFAEGLGFTQLPYKIEWHESKVRLEAIDRDGHDVLIKKLGGQIFLAHLRDAQSRYGDAIGVTEIPTETTLKVVRTKQAAALDALRLYVTRAASHADPEEPGSEELAEKLLAPIVKWESSPAGDADDDPAADEAAPEGGAPGAPVAPASPPKG